MIPMLQDVKSKNRIQKLYFVGLNKKEMVADNELIDGYNLNTDNLPALSPRESREVLVSEIAASNGFTLFDDKIVYQDGTEMYYHPDIIPVGTLENNNKSYTVYNKELIIVPDKKYFDGTTIESLQGTIYLERGDLDEEGLVILDENKIRTRGYIMVVSGEVLTFSNDSGYTHDVYEFDKDFGFIKVTKGLASQKTLGSDTENVKIVLNGADVNTQLTVNTNKGYPSEGELPDISFVVEHYNRLFGIKDNSIYGSAWGDKDNWAYFVPVLDNNSYAIDTRSPGDFVAIGNFQNHVVFFKENEMRELYGYNPSDFQLQTISEIGCIGQYALCEHNNVLYFLSDDEIYAYSGGIPRPIGDKLNLDKIIDGSIAGNKDKLYVSLTQDGTNYENYVYDVLKNSWLPLDNKQVLRFVNYKGNLYALTVDGNIEKYHSGDELISWGFTTKEFNDNSFNNKVTTKIRFRMKMDYRSTIKVYIRYNQESWELKGSYTNNDNNDRKTMKVVLAPQRHQIFQIKVECKGYSIIMGEREVYEVSDRNVKN